MKKKKILSICLAALMAGGLLAGCGGNASKTEGSSSESASEQKGAASGKETVNFWYLWR